MSIAKIRNFNMVFIFATAVVEETLIVLLILVTWEKNKIAIETIAIEIL